MSKKNLARSVLEGGRYHGNVVDRRLSNSQLRSRERAAFSVVRDREDAEEVVYPTRKHVYREFDDKLSPAFRWLSSQVGRPWSKVYSELRQRFDSRTTAGRHILFCHVIPSVAEYGAIDVRYYRMRVDQHGLLRPAPERRSYSHGKWEAPVAPDVVAWIAGRRVGQLGGALFWFVLTEAGAYRQERRLSQAEEQRFRALPDSFRERTAPAYREPAK
ncbi:MAG: hypothetical protein QM756_01955 [Polyangiaceae bacterium]